MIIANYSTFRHAANPGGTIGVDGLPVFDPTNMRANGFDGGIEITTTVGNLPMRITCNGEGFDAVDFVDEYDWYISQKTSIEANKPFTISRDDGITASFSGTILVDLATWAEIEYPTPFDLSTIRVLFFGVDIYAIRRSDGAIQRLDLMKYLIDALSPKTGVG